MNLSEILRSFGTPPDSWTPPKEHPRLVGNCLVYVYQFLTSNSNFKTTSNLQNFLFHNRNFNILLDTIPRPFPIQKKRQNSQRYCFLGSGQCFNCVNSCFHVFFLHFSITEFTGEEVSMFFFSEISSRWASMQFIDKCFIFITFPLLSTTAPTACSGLIATSR